MAYAQTGVLPPRQKRGLRSAATLNNNNETNNFAELTRK